MVGGVKLDVCYMDMDTNVWESSFNEVELMEVEGGRKDKVVVVGHMTEVKGDNEDIENDEIM